MANILLAASKPDEPDTLGKNWVGEYFQRIPAIQTRLLCWYDIIVQNKRILE